MLFLRCVCGFVLSSSGERCSRVPDEVANRGGKHYRFAPPHASVCSHDLLGDSPAALIVSLSHQMRRPRTDENQSDPFGIPSRGMLHEGSHSAHPTCAGRMSVPPKASQLIFLTCGRQPTIWSPPFKVWARTSALLSHLGDVLHFDPALRDCPLHTGMRCAETRPESATASPVQCSAPCALHRVEINNQV